MQRLRVSGRALVMAGLGPALVVAGLAEAAATSQPKVLFYRKKAPPDLHTSEGRSRRFIRRGRAFPARRPAAMPHFSVWALACAERRNDVKCYAVQYYP